MRGYKKIQIPNELKSLGTLGIGGNPFRDKEINEYLNHDNKIKEEVARRNMIAAKLYDEYYTTPENPNVDLQQVNTQIENAIELFNKSLDNTSNFIDNEKTAKSSFDSINYYNTVIRQINNNSIDNSMQTRYITQLQQSQFLLSSLVEKIHDKMMALLVDIEHKDTKANKYSAVLKNYSSLLVVFSLMLEYISTSKLKLITINDIRENYNLLMHKAFPTEYNKIADLILTISPDVKQRFENLQEEYGRSLTPAEKKRVLDLYTARTPVETFLNKDILNVLKNDESMSESDTEEEEENPQEEEDNQSEEEEPVIKYGKPTKADSRLMEKIRQRMGVNLGYDVDELGIPESKYNELKKRIEYTDNQKARNKIKAREAARAKRGKGLNKQQLAEHYFKPRGSDMLYNGESNEIRY